MRRVIYYQLRERVASYIINLVSASRHILSTKRARRVIHYQLSECVASYIINLVMKLQAVKSHLAAVNKTVFSRLVLPSDNVLVLYL